jgi:acyl-CoA synthetase (AMP-forming)/AMP-acid ligase II
VTIENALYDHDRVLTAAAIGVPDPRLGELPAAVVVTKQGMDVSESELLSFVKER